MNGQSGYIAVLATLIIGAVSLGITLSVLTLGTATQQNTLATQWGAQARAMADACAEEGLQQLQETAGAYTGTGNVTLSGQACSYTVTNTGGSTRTISTSATIGNVVRKMLVYVTITASSISVTSWQEVG